MSDNWNRLPEGIKQFKTPYPHLVVMKLEAEGIYNIYAFAAPDTQKFTISKNGELKSANNITGDCVHTYNDTTGTITLASRSRVDYNYISASSSQSTASAEYVLFSTVDLYDASYASVIREKDDKPTANCDLDDFYLFDPQWSELKGMDVFNPQNDAFLVLYGESNYRFSIFIIKDAKEECHLDISKRINASYLYFYLDQPREVIKLEYTRSDNSLSETITSVLEFLPSISFNKGIISTIVHFTNIPIITTGGASVIRPQKTQFEVLPDQIVVEPASITGATGDTVALDVKVLPADALDKSYTLSSSAINYVKVNDDNTLSLLKSGTANVTVTSNRVPTLSTTVSVAVCNRPVIKSLTYSPTHVIANEAVEFNYTVTYDKAEFQAEEWEGKQDSYELGDYTVRLRVQDTNGFWSEWAELSFTVGGPLQAPVVESLTIDPEVPLVGGWVTFNYTATYDPRSAYKAVEWDNKQSYYLAGTHTVRVRVQDTNLLWSEWKELTFYVPATPEINAITMNPTNPVAGQPVEFDYTMAILDERATIVEEIWTNKKDIYEEEGYTTVSLKVIDSFGHESSSKNVKFTVQSAYSAPEISNLTMIPENPEPGEEVSFIYDKSMDSRLTLKAENWVNKQASYGAGTHTVKLSITDSADQVSNELSLTFTIESPFELPVIDNLRIEPATPQVGETVTFSYDKVLDDRLTLKAENWEGKQESYEEGQHTVTLSITDSADQVSNELSLTFDVVYVPSVPVVSDLTITPTQPIAGDAVTFSYQANLDPKATVVEEIWRNKHDSYEAGRHEVGLKIKDSFDQVSEEAVIAFTVERRKDQPIISNLTITPANPTEGESVEFSYDAVLDAELTLLSENWVNKRESYEAGTHTVSLTITDSDNQISNELSLTFEVKEVVVVPPPVDEEEVVPPPADEDPTTPEPDGYPYIYEITVDPPHPRVGELLSYTYTVALAKDSNVKTINWTGKQAIYYEPGLKTVTLEVIDDRGLSATKTIEFMVGEASETPVEPKPVRVKHLEVTRWDSASKRFLILEGREK